MQVRHKKIGINKKSATFEEIFSAARKPDCEEREKIVELNP